MEFQLFIPMLPLTFVGKIRKMLVDLLKMSKILMDFLRFFEKSVEFFAPNTDWEVSDVQSVSVSYTHLPSPRDKRQSRMPSSA